MRNQFRGNLVLGAFKKETFETAKETFLLPILEFGENFFCNFRKFEIKYYIKICLVIIIISLLSSNK